VVIGDPSVFALESEITRAFEPLSLCALGFFVIHVMGEIYGFREPGATILGTAINDIGARIARRGTHKPPFPMNANADEIAVAVRRSIYADCNEKELFFGLSQDYFAKTICSCGLLWAPDGEEGFDDDSYVLHLEDENQVRLVAFKSAQDYQIDPASLRDVWLPPDSFYSILQNWHDTFMVEWKSLPKVADGVS
jgi:hypothetical protein